MADRGQVTFSHRRNEDWIKPVRNQCYIELLFTIFDFIMQIVF